jgi:hypothetical protein
MFKHIQFTETNSDLFNYEKMHLIKKAGYILHISRTQNNTCLTCYVTEVDL